jgi:uncharacterized protein YgbK (DUF1537 family)
MSPGIDKDALFSSLLPPWPESLLGEIQRKIAASGQRFVVLDDDPTGGQTLHGMPVIAARDDETLRAEVERSSAFFLLTNSRALSQPDAVALGEQIGRQLRRLGEKSGRELIVGSRGDSTLRGHYPAETDALYRGLTGDDQARPTTILAPYFGEGGRFTVNDTQYVLQGSDLVPVAETEFARDPAFAYEHSHLPSWLRARSGEALEVASVSIEELRRGGPDAVASKLRAVPEGSTVIVNATCERDLEVFVAGLLDAEAEGRRFLYRTAASFVRVRAGIEQRPPLTAQEMGSAARGGGLIVVGSYVDRTSQQLQSLLVREGLRSVELKVRRLFDADSDGEIARVAAAVGRALQSGDDVVLFTSRELTREARSLNFQAIGQRITAVICDVLQRLDSRPAFLLVKGGSTACRVAVDSLGVKRAMVLGQLLPGVPVWRLGEECRFPGLPYIVFPGNVGGPDALNQALDILHGGTHAGPG